MRVFQRLFERGGARWKLQKEHGWSPAWKHAPISMTERALLLMRVPRAGLERTALVVNLLA